MTVEELKAKFTADTADFKAKLDGMKKQLSETGNISDNLQKTIDKGMKSSSEKTQAASRKLKDMNRKLEEQKAKLKDAITNTEIYTAKMDGLKDEFSRQNAEVERQRKVVRSLETAYGKIRSEVEKIGGKETLSKQLENAVNEADKLDAQIREIQSNINASKGGNLVFVGEELMSIDKAKIKIQELITQQETAVEKARQIDNAFASIGESNIKYASSEGLKKLKTEIAKAKKELEQLRTQANKTNSQIAQTAQKAANEYKKVEKANAVYEKLKAHIQQLQNKLINATSFAMRFKTAIASCGSVNTVFKKATSAIGGTIVKLRSVPIYLKNITASAKNSSSQLARLPNFFKRIAGAAAALSLARGIFGQLRSVISYYMSQNEALYERVNSLKMAFGQMLAPAIEVVVSAFEKLMPYLIAIGNAIMEVLSSLSIFAGFKETSSAIDGVTASTNALSKAQQELYGFDKITKQSDDSSSSSTTLPNYGTAEIGSIDEIISKITSSINNAMASIDWESVKNKAKSFASELSEAFNQLFNGIDWQLAGKTVSEGLNTVTTSINTFVDGVKWGDIGSDLAQSLNSAVSNLDWEGVGKTFSAKWKILTDTMKTAIEEFDFRNLGSGISEGINSWFDNISWEDVSGNISGAISGALETIAETLENVDWQSLATKTAEFVKGIKWGDMASSLFESLGAALGGIGSYIGELLSIGWQNFTDYWDNYISWGDTPGEIISGLFEGISDAVSNIGTWIKEHIFQPFIDGFKKAFGIASPAKEMKPMGGYIIDGLKEGLGDIWSKVKEKFDALKAKLKQWFTDKKAEISKGWKDFTSGVKDVKASISAKFSQKAEDVKKAWSDRTSGIKNKSATMKAAFSQKKEDVTKKWNSITSGVKNVSSTVSAKMWKTKEKINEWFYEKIGDILSWTSYVFMALASGKETVTNLWNKIKEWWGKKSVEVGLALKDGFSQAFQNILTNIVNMLNKVIDALNKVPGVDIKKIQVPQFAKGGIIDTPTLAMVGEAGKEAVMPLENNTGWISVLAGQIVQLMGGADYSGSGGAKTVVIPIYIGSKKISEVVIDDINKQTDATGRCPIRI